jgi:hypothetical protein
VIRRRRRRRRREGRRRSKKKMHVKEEKGRYNNTAKLLRAVSRVEVCVRSQSVSHDGSSALCGGLLQLDC